MNLPVKEAAQLLAVSEKTIYRWVKLKTIPFFRVGKQYRFNRAELLEWTTSRRLKINPKIFVEPEADLQPPPSLTTALATGGIHYRVEGKDRDAVLSQIAQLVRLPEEVDRRHLLELTLAREALSSTAIGEGIAIPHVRNSVLLNVNKPTLALCFLEQPIDFAALDGMPVRILFPLFSPTIKTHLTILARLAFVLRKQRLKEVLGRQGRREEVFAALRECEQELCLPS